MEEIQSFLLDLKNFECTECLNIVDLEYNGTINPVKKRPQFRCPVCKQTRTPDHWPPLKLNQVLNEPTKRRKENPPSPTTSSNTTRKDNDNSTIQELKETIKTLQATIKQMANLIKELTPLQQSVSKLELRIKNLENQTKLPDIKTPMTQDTKSNSSPTKETGQQKEQWSTVVKKHKPKSTRHRRIESAKTTFQSPPTMHKKITILYMPSRHRVNRSETRQKLRSVGIQTHRILDIHYPARNTIGLMVHEDYETAIRNSLSKHDIPLLDFDPLDPNNLENPKYEDMEVTARYEQAVYNQKTRLLRALSHVREHVYTPLARTLIAQGWLTEADVASDEDVSENDDDDDTADDDDDDGALSPEV
jgi:TolA-binding protein